MKAEHAGKMVKFVTQLTVTLADPSPLISTGNNLVHCIGDAQETH